MTITTPIGKVKIMYKGKEPRVVLSFSASSTKIDAMGLKGRGKKSPKHTTAATGDTARPARQPRRVPP
jgi:hypothetical protein